MGIERYSGPGHWNDYDMLIVGLDGKSKQLVGTGASNIEYRTHFSLWAMVSSPMLVGADVRKLDPYSLQTLTNREYHQLREIAIRTVRRGRRPSSFMPWWAMIAAVMSTNSASSPWKP